MSVQCVLFSFYDAAHCLRVELPTHSLPAGLLISQWFTNPQLFGIDRLAVIILVLAPAMQNTNILRRSFEGVFVGLGLCELAWVTIGLIRNRSKGCEDLRRLGVDWIAWQRGGSLCQTNNWLSEQAPGLTHVLIKQKTKTRTETLTMTNRRQGAEISATLEALHFTTVSRVGEWVRRSVGRCFKQA